MEGIFALRRLQNYLPSLLFFPSPLVLQMSKLRLPRLRHGHGRIYNQMQKKMVAHIDGIRRTRGIFKQCMTLFRLGMALSFLCGFDLMQAVGCERAEAFYVAAAE